MLSRDVWAKSGTVVLLTAVATALRYFLNPILEGRSPLLFHVLAVAIAAQIAGTVSGLVMTALSALLIDYLFVAPKFSLAMGTGGDQLALLFFVVAGVLLSFFGGWRKRMQSQLERAYERLALKQEVARMGMFEWSVPEGRVEWSPEMERIYGISTATRIHTLADWQALVHPEDRAEAVAALEDTARKRLPTFDQTYRIIRPDGQVRWIHTRRQYSYDAHGKPVHVFGVNLDVTELKQGEMAQAILGGLLHVCSSCRRIRDAESDAWYSMEGYLRVRSTAKVSHGMCDDCARQWYPGSADSTADEQLQ